jgi:hypothetical protein
MVVPSTLGIIESNTADFMMGRALVETESVYE